MAPTVLRFETSRLPPRYPDWKADEFTGESTEPEPDQVNMKKQLASLGRPLSFLRFCRLTGYPLYGTIQRMRVWRKLR